MDTDWTKSAANVEGPHFAKFQTALAKYNETRLDPGLPEETERDQVAQEARVAAAEIAFVEKLRKTIAPITKSIPSDADGFVAWFERLKEHGPGQGDPLFPWLATRATRRSDDLVHPAGSCR